MLAQHDFDLHTYIYWNNIQLDMVNHGTRLSADYTEDKRGTKLALNIALKSYQE
jgi:hypothetical protein